MLDEAYERFVTKKGGEVKQERKRTKRINPDADADLLKVIISHDVLIQWQLHLKQNFYSSKGVLLYIFFLGYGYRIWKVLLWYDLLNLLG